VSHLAALADPALPEDERVTVIYLEHFLRVAHQAYLDQHHVAGGIADWPWPLDAYLNGIAARGLDPDGLVRKVLAVAKSRGVRVVAIDDELAHQYEAKDWTSTQHKSVARVGRMNTFAHAVIIHDRADRPGGRFLVVTGRSHARTYAPRGVGIPGLAQLLGLPAVMFTRLAGGLLRVKYLPDIAENRLREVILNGVRLETVRDGDLEERLRTGTGADALVNLVDPTSPEPDGRNEILGTVGAAPPAAPRRAWQVGGRQPGTVVLTPGGDLARVGITQVAHVVAGNEPAQVPTALVAAFGRLAQMGAVEVEVHIPAGRGNGLDRFAAVVQALRWSGEPPGSIRVVRVVFTKVVDIMAARRQLLSVGGWRDDHQGTG
jgi:hypothetical protein